MYENVKQKKVCKERQWVALCTNLYSSLTPTIAQLVLYYKILSHIVLQKTIN